MPRQYEFVKPRLNNDIWSDSMLIDRLVEQQNVPQSSLRNSPMEIELAWALLKEICHVQFVHRPQFIRHLIKPMTLTEKTQLTEN